MRNNETSKLANIKMLQFVATQLGELCKEVVFLGGCTTALFITDLAAPDVRYTLDVDCIVDVISLSQYYQLEQKLHKHKFKKSLNDDVICRWRYENAILDVMPTDEKILGFGNRWYKSAVQYATLYPLSYDLKIQLVTAPHFFATKLEAFKDRGKMDFIASSDFEDIISVLDGHSEIIAEIMDSEIELRKYLALSFKLINDSPSFHDALPGQFVYYGSLADERIKYLIQKITAITQIQ